MSKAVFKPYQQNQIYLLPQSIAEIIEERHPVRKEERIIGISYRGNYLRQKAMERVESDV